MKFSNLGELIKYHRKEKGWTQEELAEKIRASEAGVSEYERNEYKPKSERLGNIKVELGILDKEIEEVYPEYKKIQRADNLGYLLKKKRFEKGLTQRKLAEKVGASKVMICRYERNECKPGFEKLRRIKVELGILDKEIEEVYPEYKKIQRADNLGYLLKKKRVEKGLTRKELAKRTGINENIIGWYERNERKPKPERLGNIKVELGILDKEIEEVYPEYKKIQRADGIGNLLMKKRFEKGLTHEELAEKIGAARGQISLYERNKCKPKFKRLEKLVEILEILEKELERVDKRYYEEYLKHKGDKEKNLDGLVEAIKEYMRR